MLTYLLLALIVGVIVRTMATARHGGAGSDKELTELRERMLRLEQSVETMTADMERVSEGQRFLTSLLEERAKSPPAIKPPAAPSPES